MAGINARLAPAGPQTPGMAMLRRPLSAAVRPTLQGTARANEGRHAGPVQCFAESSTARNELVKVRFSTHFKAAFGEKLKLVGSEGCVGAWDVAAAPEMAWTDGHVWTTTLELPRSAGFEFKVVHVTASGVTWERCSNRSFALEAAAAASDAQAVEVVCTWNHPTKTRIEHLSASALLAGPLQLGEEASSGAAREDAAHSNGTEHANGAAKAWDPTVGGLPADVTADLLSAPSKPAAKPNKKAVADFISAATRAVAPKKATLTPALTADTTATGATAPKKATLTPALAAHTTATTLPEAAVASTPAAVPEASSYTSAASPISAPSHQAEASPVAALVVEPQQPAEQPEPAPQPLLRASAAEAPAAAVSAPGAATAVSLPALTAEVLPPRPSEGGTIRKKARRTGGKKGGSSAKKGSMDLGTMGKAAGLAVAAGVAGVAMTALAVDITDVALTSAIVAAGATLLPGGAGENAKQMQSASLKALGAGLSAAESLARGFGLKSHAERRAEEVADLEEADARLATSIAVAEAFLQQAGEDALTSLAADGATEEDALSALLADAVSGAPASGPVLAATVVAALDAEQLVATTLGKAAGRREM